MSFSSFLALVISLINELFSVELFNYTFLIGGNSVSICIGHVLVTSIVFSFFLYLLVPHGGH